MTPFFNILHCAEAKRVHILSIESFLMTLIARERGRGLVRQGSQAARQPGSQAVEAAREPGSQAVEAARQRQVQWWANGARDKQSGGIFEEKGHRRH